MVFFCSVWACAFGDSSCAFLGGRECSECTIFFYFLGSIQSTLASMSVCVCVCCDIVFERERTHSLAGEGELFRV